MGNLNQFYLLGRIARQPATRGEGESAYVVLAVRPGTGGRGPRVVEPLDLIAAGPQAPIARALRPGQSVLLRGQLHQAPAEGGAPARLEAWIKAIEVVADAGPPREPGAPRPEGAEEGEPGEGGSPRESGRRRRRRRGRKGRAGGDGATAPEEGAHEAPPEPVRPESPPLPPPTPIVQAPAKPAAPDPTYRADMPF